MHKHGWGNLYYNNEKINNENTRYFQIFRKIVNIDFFRNFWVLMHFKGRDFRVRDFDNLSLEQNFVRSLNFRGFYSFFF